MHPMLFLRTALRLLLCGGFLGCAAVIHAESTSTNASRSAVDSPWPARLQAVVGHAQLLRLPPGVQRVAVGDPTIADYQLMGDDELYLLGKANGTTNLLLWTDKGQRRSITVEVQPDAGSLTALLQRLFPREEAVAVQALPGGLVLTGSVSDAPTKAAMESVARQFLARSGPASPASASASSPSSAAAPPASAVAGRGAQLLNLVSLRDPQQVVLEVKIAEVSKTLVERLGVRTADPGQQTRWSLVPNLTGNAVEGTLGLILGAAGLSNVVLDAQKNDGLVKILAEPNIVALSGQEGRFLVGGRLFIPVTLPGTGGGLTTTLEERPFGVSLAFTPTVLTGSEVQLKVRAEVSEVAREPLRFTAGTASAVIPAITSRDVSTTVQIAGSQSLVIGGLLRNNRTQSVKAFPILGELPIIGALFRSTDFNDDKTELVIIVTPKLLPVRAASASGS